MVILQILCVCENMCLVTEVPCNHLFPAQKGFICIFSIGGSKGGTRNATSLPISFIFMMFCKTIGFCPILRALLPCAGKSRIHHFVGGMVLEK